MFIIVVILSREVYSHYYYLLWLNILRKILTQYQSLCHFPPFTYYHFITQLYDLHWPTSLFSTRNLSRSESKLKVGTKIGILEKLKDREKDISLELVDGTS